MFDPETIIILVQIGIYILCYAFWTAEEQYQEEMSASPLPIEIEHFEEVDRFDIEAIQEVEEFLAKDPFEDLIVEVKLNEESQEK